MIASQVALEIILRARDEASRVVEQSNRAFNVLQGAVAGLVSGGLNIAYDAAIGVARGAAQAGKALWDMASNAAPIQGISAAFRGVATDASATLEILRQGALGDRDHMLGFGADRTRFGIRGLNTLIAKQIVDQAAPQRIPLTRRPPKLLSCYSVSHNG